MFRASNPGGNHVQEHRTRTNRIALDDFSIKATTRSIDAMRKLSEEIKRTRARKQSRDD